MATSPYTGVQWDTGTVTTRVTWSFATKPGELVAFAAYITDAAYQGAVRKAFSVWENIAAIDFVEVADDLANGIRMGWSYIDKAGGTLASATWRSSGGKTIESEIRFDLDETWKPDTSGKGTQNLHAVAVHEIGHAIGLAHVDDKTSVMFPTANGVAYPSADDVSHVRSLYGAALSTDVFRFYDADTGLHFFTNSVVERDSVVASLPKLHYEGPAFKVPSQGVKDAALDVFRFLDDHTGAHFYTASTAERDRIQAEKGHLHYEGPAFKAYADAGANAEHAALHRFLRTDTGTHFYTTSESEKASIQSTLPLFRYEGVAYFVDA